MGEDSSDEMNSKLIALQALEGQYRNKLTEYESGYATYISALQSQNSGSSSYVVLPGQTYMGTGSISETKTVACQCVKHLAAQTHYAQEHLLIQRQRFAS